MAAQDQALRTNWLTVMIDKRQGSAMCRMCWERDETISHIVSECKKLAQNEYKKWRHDKVVAVIHWHLSQVWISLRIKELRALCR